MRELARKGWPNPDHALDWYEHWQHQQTLREPQTIDEILMPTKRKHLR